MLSRRVLKDFSFYLSSCLSARVIDTPKRGPIPQEGEFTAVGESLYFPSC